MGKAAFLSPGDDATGYVDGRHFSTYASDIQALKRARRDGELETLLLRLIDATEAETTERRRGVSAPAYYRHAALLYRQQKRFKDEIAILQRQIRFWAVAGRRDRFAEYRLQRAERLLKQQDRQRDDEPGGRGGKTVDDARSAFSKTPPPPKDEIARAVIRTRRSAGVGRRSPRRNGS